MSPIQPYLRNLVLLPMNQTDVQKKKKKKGGKERKGAERRGEERKSRLTAVYLTMFQTKS